MIGEKVGDVNDKKHDSFNEPGDAYERRKADTAIVLSWIDDSTDEPNQRQHLSTKTCHYLEPFHHCNHSCDLQKFKPLPKSYEIVF